MAENWQQGLTSVLESTNIAFLATQGPQSPETSMVPYAMFEGDILLHLSDLAKHRQNIKQSSAVGLMICTPESKQSSPLALPRISFQGFISQISKNEFESAKAVYLKKIPEAEPLFSFADFSLYRLSIDTVYWVGGFGSARKLSLESWRSLIC